MPGEAQKVDRIMQAFAAALYRDAPGPFVDADAAYVCAFSLMMLNTDLHNPSIKEERRMTKQGFRRQNADFNLEDEYLDAIYDRIKVIPFSLGLALALPLTLTLTLSLTLTLTLALTASR